MYIHVSSCPLEIGYGEVVLRCFIQWLSHCNHPHIPVRVTFIPEVQQLIYNYKGYEVKQYQT